MPIIRDYIDIKELPYTTDVVIWKENNYYKAKIRGGNYFSYNDPVELIEKCIEEVSYKDNKRIISLLLVDEIIIDIGIWIRKQYVDKVNFVGLDPNRSKIIASKDLQNHPATGFANMIVLDPYTSIEIRNITLDNSLYEGSSKTQIIYGGGGNVNEVKCINCIFRYSSYSSTDHGLIELAAGSDYNNTIFVKNCLVEFVDGITRKFVWTYKTRNIKLIGNTFINVNNPIYIGWFSPLPEIHINQIVYKNNVELITRNDVNAEGIDISCVDYALIVDNYQDLTHNNIVSNENISQGGIGLSAHGPVNKCIIARNTLCGGHGIGLWGYGGGSIIITQNNFINIGQYVLQDRGVFVIGELLSDRSWNCVRIYKNNIINPYQIFDIKIGASIESYGIYCDIYTYRSLPTLWNHEGLPIIYYDGTYYYIAIYKDGAWRKVQLS